MIKRKGARVSPCKIPELVLNSLVEPSFVTTFEIYFFLLTLYDFFVVLVFMASIIVSNPFYSTIAVISFASSGFS